MELLWYFCGRTRETRDSLPSLLKKYCGKRRKRLLDVSGVISFLVLKVCISHKRFATAPKSSSDEFMHFRLKCRRIWTWVDYVGVRLGRALRWLQQWYLRTWTRRGRFRRRLRVARDPLRQPTPLVFVREQERARLFKLTLNSISRGFGWPACCETQLPLTHLHIGQLP